MILKNEKKIEKGSKPAAPRNVKFNLPDLYLSTFVPTYHLCIIGPVIKYLAQEDSKCSQALL